MQVKIVTGTQPILKCMAFLKICRKEQVWKLSGKVKLKQLLTPRTLNIKENPGPERQTHSEEVEMKGLVAVINDDYYFDATSALGTLIQFLFL